MAIEPTPEPDFPVPPSPPPPHFEEGPPICPPPPVESSPPPVPPPLEVNTSHKTITGLKRSIGSGRISIVGRGC